MGQIDQDISSQERLEQLGYKQELQRTLSTKANIALSVSNVSPVMAVFLFALAPLAVAGTATAAGAIILTVVVFFNALVLAELAGSYPVSGGLYSFVRFVLPRPLAFVAVINFLLQSLIFPPSIALGVGTYIQILFPQLPQSSLATSVIAAIVLIVALLIGLKNIGTGTKVTITLLIVQIAVLGTFIIGGFANAQQNLTSVIMKPVMLGENGAALIAAGLGIVFMSVGTCFGVINGYDASLGFAEETKGPSRNVSHAVIASAIIASIAITVSILASMVGAPNILDYLSATSPFMYTADAALGNWGSTFVNIGVLVASFGALIVIIIYMARVLYTTGRDRIWPDSINNLITKVSEKERIPWVATLVIAGASLILVFASSLVAMISFVGVLVASVYLLIAIGAINNRIKKPDEYRPFKMPFYPIPAVIVALGTAFVIFSQSVRDISLTGVFCALSLTYYYLYIKPRNAREMKQKGPDSVNLQD